MEQNDSTPESPRKSCKSTRCHTLSHGQDSVLQVVERLRLNLALTQRAKPGSLGQTRCGGGEGLRERLVLGENSSAGYERMSISRSPGRKIDFITWRIEGGENIVNSVAEPGGELCRPAYDLEKPSTLLVSWRPPQTSSFGEGGVHVQPAGMQVISNKAGTEEPHEARAKSSIKNSTAYSIGVSHSS
ncbi:hypothetical protein CC79DRAFT_1127549 [Sarocladium strictum]